MTWHTHLTQGFRLSFPRFLGSTFLQVRAGKPALWTKVKVDTFFLRRESWNAVDVITMFIDYFYHHYKLCLVFIYVTMFIIHFFLLSLLFFGMVKTQNKLKAERIILQCKWFSPFANHVLQNEIKSCKLNFFVSFGCNGLHRCLGAAVNEFVCVCVWDCACMYLHGCIYELHVFRYVYFQVSLCMCV